MAQGYSVTISAVDQVSAPLANIGKELSQLSRNLKQFQKDSAAPTGSQEKAGFFERAKEFATKGSHEVGKGLREIGHEAREAGRRIGEAFEPIAKLGGLGTGAISGLGLLGVAEGLGRIAESGQNLLHTSQRIGVSTQAIQGLGNAAKIAGSSSEAMSAGLVSLQEKLTGAALGQDSEAIAFFKQFNVGVRNASDGSIRLADKVLPELADAIAAQKNPTVQAAMAVRAFGEAGILLLPILRQGHEGIERLRKEGDKLDDSTRDWVHTADEYKTAQDKVGVAIGGLGKSIATELLPKMKPLTDGFADWLGELQKTPAALKAIEVGIYALGAAAAFATLGGGLKLLRALLPLGVTGAAVGLPLALGGSTPHAGEGLDDYNKQHFVPVPGVVDPRNGKVVRSVAPNGMITYHDNSLGSPAPSSLPPGASGAGEYGVGQPGTRGRPNFNGVTVPIPGKQGAASGGYSLGQMKTLALKAGFKGQDADTMAALAMVESSGNPNARGKAGEMGLTQINPHAWGDDLARQALDPQRAFDIAHDVYQKQGWDAWKNSIPGAQAYLSGGGIKPEALADGHKRSWGQRITSLLGIGSANAAPMMVPNLGKYAIPGREESANKANPEFASRLSSLFEAMPDNLQGSIQINNAFRGIEKQQELYAASHGSGMVAPPGRSMHNFGLAADLGGSDLARKGAALAWVHAHASEYGLQFPMQNEPWHIEPAELRNLGPEGFLKKYGAGQKSDNPPAPTPQEDKRSDLDFLKNGDAGDSKTHVHVDFNNAPQGTRTRIASADGPARTSLRTQFAFGAI